MLQNYVIKHIFHLIVGNPEVLRMASAVTTRASTPGIESIIAKASADPMAMQEVAYASASMQDGAITVAESMSVTAGRPVTGLMVCHTRPSGVVL